MMTTGTATQASKRPPVRVVRFGRVSFRVNVRIVLLCGISLSIVFTLGMWALTLGDFNLRVDEAIDAITDSGTKSARFIVVDLRFPRTITAVLIGSMLAMSGAIFQGLVRNPLVSPDIIGINAGAAMFAVFWIVNHYPLEFLPAVAFMGAVSATVTIPLELAGKHLRAQTHPGWDRGKCIPHGVHDFPCH